MDRKTQTGFDVIGLGDLVTQFQLWIVNNPNLGNDIAPWVLMGLGGASLIYIYGEAPAQRMWRRYKGYDLEFITGTDFPLSQVAIYETQPSGEMPARHFVRVGLRNNTEKTITGVHIQIQEIEGVSAVQLPQSLRPRDDMPEKIELSPGKTEYWDTAKWWVELPKGDERGIYLCFYRKENRGYIPDGNYSFRLVAYADDRNPTYVDARLSTDEDFLSIDLE